MSEVEVRVSKRTGQATVRGEGFETAAFKESLKGLGKVTEEHVGSEHVHDEDRQHVHG